MESAEKNIYAPVETTPLISILKSLPDVIWSYSPIENRLIFISPSCEKLLGYSSTEFYNNNSLWKSILVDEDVNKRKSAMLQINEEKVVVETNYRIRTKTGEMKWIKDIFVPVIDENDSLIRVDGIIKDITEVIEKENKFKRIFNLSSNLMFFIDLRGKEFYFENVNRQFRKLLRYSPIELTSVPLKNFDDEIIRAIIHNSNTCMREGKEIRFEFELNDNSNPKNFLFTLTPFYHSQDDISKLIGTGEDITELKAGENRLKKLNEDKNRLLSIVSHDLKSPFNTMLGFIELLSNDIELEETEKSDYLRFLYESSKRQVELINDLLDWSKVESGLLEFSPRYLSLRKIIDKVLMSYKGQAFQKKIEFEVNIDKHIHLFFDKNYSKVVISNLISNAIKFSHKNGKIIILAEDDDEFIKLKIQDFGIGISERYLKNLFVSKENHSRTGTAGEKGTGLGLKLCYDIMTSNHGQLLVNSSSNEGTTVKLEFLKPKTNILYFDDHNSTGELKKFANSLLPESYVFVTSDIFEASKYSEEFNVHLAFINLDVIRNFQIVFLLKVFNHLLSSQTPLIGLAENVNDDFTSLMEILPIQKIIPSHSNISDIISLIN
ncbi:MAG: PAS domain S-box protein [Ignavibacteria bacterium]|nr:PAS domain S-box protein [Ignavibacteria bacterium]